MEEKRVIKGLSEGSSQEKYQLLFEATDNPRQEYFSILINLLSEEDEWVRLNAVLAVSALGDSRALPPLLDALKMEKNDYVKAALLKTLGKLGNKKLLPVIVPFFHDSDNRVVANALEAVELIGDRSIADKVRPFLSHDEVRVRVNAAKALWKFGYIDALDELLGMLDSEEEWVRDSVIYVLGEINTPQTRNILCKQLQKETDSIKMKIIQVLERIGDDVCIPALRECLKGKSLRVAEAAQWALAGITMRRGKYTNCPECNALNRHNNRFCGQCGAKITWKTTQEE